MAEGFVALLRGVNVGGGNKVPMAELRALATALGWSGVASYIASGNLVFRAEGAAGDLAEALRAAMAERMGVSVPVLVLPGQAVRAALARCPWRPEAGARVHVVFLFADPVVDRTAYEALRAADEELVVEGRLAWLHAPRGIGRSVLADRLHRVLTGTEMTARNLNTLRRLVEMLDAGRGG